MMTKVHGRKRSVTAPTVRSSIVWNLATGPFLLLANLVIIPFSIWICGAVNFGAWVVCFGAVALLGQVDFGLGTAVVRQLARYRSLSEFAKEESAKQLALAIFCLTGVVLAILLLPCLLVYFGLTGSEISSSVYVPLSIMAAGTLLLTVVARCMISIIQSYGLFYPERLLALFGLISKIGILCIAAFVNKSIFLIAAADVISVAILFFGSAVYLQAKRIGPRSFSDMRRSQGVLRELAKFGAPTFLSSFSTLLSIQLPLFFVGALVGLSDAAVFSALTRLFMSARAVFGWITSPMLPSLAGNVSIERSSVAHKCEKTILAAAGICCAAVGPCIISGQLLLSSWLGETANGSGLSLVFISCAIFLYAIYSPGVVFATALGSPGVVAKQNVVVLLLTVGLSVVLPSYLGVAGGALSVLLGIFIVLPFSQFACSKLTGARWVRLNCFCLVALGFSISGSYMFLWLSSHISDANAVAVGGVLAGGVVGTALVYAIALRPFLTRLLALGPLN